jgi:hypothetical protein
MNEQSPEGFDDVTVGMWFKGCEGERSGTTPGGGGQPSTTSNDF